MSIALDTFPDVEVTPYDDLRDSLQNGDVLLCSGSGFFSMMIQQATESIWSHVAFVLRIDSIDRIMVLESVEKIGVRTVALSKYLKDYEDNEPYPGGLVMIRNRRFNDVADPQRLQQLSEFAVDLFGRPYNSTEIAKIAARILASRIPFTVEQQDRLQPDREYICSEYVSACYESIGLTIPWNRLGFIAPADFAADPDFDLVAVLQKK